MARSTNNAIYFRRRRKLYLSPVPGAASLPPEYIATLLRNLESLGYTFSAPLIDICRTLTEGDLVALYEELVPMLQRARGAHREFQPMYPNFPSEVMMAGQGTLYLNAVLHYITEGRYLPESERKERMPLLDEVELTVLELGTEEEFERIFTRIVASNTSISDQDKADVAWFVEQYASDIERLLPESIPHKENMAFVMALLIRQTDAGSRLIERYCRTATDLLRVAAALWHGDVSLAKPARFGSFPRRQRRMLLDILDRQPNIIEDMLRWKDRWVRLGERLHPGEFRHRYRRAAVAFDIIRNDLPYTTFNSMVEGALAAGNAREALELLATRPGELARRMDHLLRLGPEHREAILDAFEAAAPHVATPLLLQLGEYFRRRGAMADREEKPLRVFFPKGNLARAYAIENTLPVLPAEICERSASICRKALLERFGLLPPLGKCYLDEKLADYIVPFSQRSASKSLRTLVRGSRLPLPDGCRVLRFFIWWKNGIGRTDIDLSATMFDEEFGYRDIISYYNLQTYDGCHSGDIVDAPEGASEFIDITLETALEADVRYIVMTLNSFTSQSYCDLPECFAGWMSRTEPDSGEIYDPRTVQDRVDIAADARIALPLIIDIVEREIIWCDISLNSMPPWPNTVHNNMKGIIMTLRSMNDLGKPTLHDLFALHIAARGEPAANPDTADTIFSVEAGTTFRLEEIASEYLA